MEGKKFVSFKYKYCVELVYINKYIHARYLKVYAMNFLIGLCTVLTNSFFIYTMDVQCMKATEVMISADE